jgi:hypothetical protein
MLLWSHWQSGAHRDHTSQDGSELVAYVKVSGADAQRAAHIYSWLRTPAISIAVDACAFAGAGCSRFGLQHLFECYAIYK